jgi:hypothetical protein
MWGADRLSAAPLFMIIISQKEYTGNDKKPPMGGFPC